MDFLNISGDNIEATVNATCDMVDGSIDAGSPPHVVLDATRVGFNSETCKSFTRALALPTYSATYGHESDLRWVEVVESTCKSTCKSCYKIISISIITSIGCFNNI